MGENSRSGVIAKNTLFLYIRTLFNMFIALYTSRVILNALGVDDYGIYNVVGGISSSFAFLSSALSNATHRFLNFEIGRNNQKKLEQIFNQNLLIYIIYALISLLIIDIGGRWLIDNKMTIPINRTDAAHWVLHSTSIILFISIISCVYESVLIAHENMKIYAYVGMYEAIVKLCVAIIVKFVLFDKLKIYALLMVIAVLSSRLILIIYSRCTYKETRLRLYWDKCHLVEIFKFSGWNFLDAFVFLLNDQGINILLNMFFGPAVNAARGISIQVKAAVMNLSGGILTAMRPQIVQSYATNDNEFFKSLLFKCGKYTFFLLWIICLAVILRIKPLLHIWLKEVPEMTSDFVVWMLIFTLINSLCDPFWQGIQAVGSLKKYVLFGNAVYLCAFPLSYFAFKAGGQPIITYQIIALIRLAYLFTVFAVFRRYVPLDPISYFKKVIIPICKVLVMSIAIAIPINSCISDSTVIHTLLGCLCIVFIASLSVLTIGISNEERNIIFHNISKMICRK